MAPPKTESPANRRRHLEMLLLAGLVLAASPFLNVGEDDRVALRWFPGLPLPPMCMSQEWFGVSCPGCGLTRSFVHLAHGDLEASLHSHRLGWLLMAAAAIQIPYRLALLRGVKRFELTNTLGNLFSWVLIGVLFLNWFLGFDGF